MILTELDMHRVCLKEQAGGRVPSDVEFHLANIPADLLNRLLKAREAASREVTREKLEQLPDQNLMTDKSADST